MVFEIDDSTLKFVGENEFWLKPFVVRGLKVGPCLERWSDPSYLEQQVGDTQVTVHVAENYQLDFIRKNFRYSNMRFDEFLSACRTSDSIYYLRSTSKKNKQPAMISNDFPSIATDFNLPNYAVPDETKIFSSILRLGSCGVRVWNHYDVMDNILIQLNGSKTIALMSPSELNNLHLGWSEQAGEKVDEDKPAVVDVDSPPAFCSRFSNANVERCTLLPGDALYIPALWHHHTSTPVDDALALNRYNASVNVFWKRLSDGQYSKSDVFGNRDPIIYQTAATQIDRIVKSFDDSFPQDHREFYIRKLINKLELKL